MACDIFDEMRTTPRPTTLIESPRLSDRLCANVTLAAETFQFTGSFKFRAANNVVTNVPNPSIITASSGNFGQAMAYACKLAGKRCTVVMPANSVKVKVEAVRAFGATVDLVDTTKVPRAQRVRELAEADPDAYVASAYDDPLVIAGNSSLGRELASLAARFDVIVAPVGGGGLLSGVIQGLRSSGDTTPVIGAEPLLANDAAQSLREGRIVASDHEIQTIADGARTMSLGKHNWAIIKDGVETNVEVSEEQIREAVRLLFSLANLKVEPTGALTTGALLASPDRFRDLRVCCVVSGGNVDPALYRDLLSV
jgi:threonine dehydratase